MRCKIKKALPYFAIILVVVITSLVIIKPTDDSAFFTENYGRINTNSITSYTIVNEDEQSIKYKDGDEQFSLINSIFEKAEVTSDHEEIYLVSEKSGERIIVKGRYKKTVFVPYKDGSSESVKIILKDFCKNKSTAYFLDNHNYLITTVSIEDYNKIFKT